MSKAVGSNLRRFVVLLPALATLILAFVFRQEMQGTDDIKYAQATMALCTGDEVAAPVFYQPTHRDARIGVLAPLLLLFSLFGVSSFSLAALPFLCTVGTASLIAWIAARAWGGACGLTAGLLYAAFPLTIGLATVCLPEPLVTFELTLAAALFLSAIESSDVRARCLELLAGLLIGLAYVTTEVGALLLPVLYLHLLVTRRIRPRDGWLAAGFLLVMGAEFAYHAAIHGNPLYRFTLTQGYLSDPMVRASNAGDLTYRLFKAYPAAFVYPGLAMGLLGPLMLAGGLYGLVRWRESSFFVMWAGAILLFYNFMTVSLTHYVVLPVAPRLLAPAFAPLFILTAKLLVDAWKWASDRAPVVVTRGIRALYVVATAGIVFVSLTAMYLDTLPNLTGAIARNAELVARHLRRQPSVTVVTDTRSAKDIQFYRQYNPRDSFLRFEEAARLRNDGLGTDSIRPVFVVLNGPVLNEAQITGQRYGGGLSLEQGDRDALDEFQPGPGAEVYTTRYRTDSLYTYLRENGAIGSFLELFDDRVTRVLVEEAPPLGDVRVFRYRGSWQ